MYQYFIHALPKGQGFLMCMQAHIIILPLTYTVQAECCGRADGVYSPYSHSTYPQYTHIHTMYVYV